MVASIYINIVIIDTKEAVREQVAFRSVVQIGHEKEFPGRGQFANTITRDSSSKQGDCIILTIKLFNFESLKEFGIFFAAWTF